MRLTWLRVALAALVSLFVPIAPCIAQNTTISPSSWAGLTNNTTPSAAAVGFNVLTGSPVVVPYLSNTFAFGQDDPPQNLEAECAGSKFLRFTGAGTFRINGTSTPLANAGDVYAIRFMVSLGHATPEAMTGTDDTKVMELFMNGGGLWFRLFYRNNTSLAGAKIMRGARISLASVAGGGTSEAYPGFDGTADMPSIAMNTPTEIIIATQYSNPGWMAVYVDRQLTHIKTGIDMTTALSAGRGDWTFQMFGSGAVSGLSVNLHPKIETWTGPGWRDKPWRTWPSNFDLSEHISTSFSPAALNSSANFDAGYVWRITSKSGGATLAATSFGSVGVNPGFGRFVLSGAAAETATVSSVLPQQTIEFNNRGWAFGSINNFLVPASDASLRVNLKNGGSTLGSFVVTAGRLSYYDQGTGLAYPIGDALTTNRYCLQWAMEQNGTELRWLLIDLTGAIDTKPTLAAGTITGVTNLFPGGKNPVPEAVMTQGASGTVEFGSMFFGKWFTLAGVDSRTVAYANAVSPNLAMAGNNMTLNFARGEPYTCAGYGWRASKPMNQRLPDMVICSVSGRSGEKITELADQADAFGTARALRWFTPCNTVNDIASLATVSRDTLVASLTDARKRIIGYTLSAGNEVIWTSECQGTHSAFTTQADTDWVINREFDECIKALATEQTYGRFYVVDIRQMQTTMYEGSSDNLHINNAGGRTFTAFFSGCVGSGYKSILSQPVYSSTPRTGFVLKRAG